MGCTIRSDPAIYTAAWDGNAANGQWRGWWKILDGVAAPGSGVAAVSRDTNKLDVFVAGTGGALWTAAWHANAAAPQWRGWWRIAP
ncbi:MAG: hypothetical protein LAP87_02935 [Acidobacteriia bacterium]|nr:hypothetical protein [Terriglobia bacterium]